MLISEKTTGAIYNFFASKEAYPIVRQLEKITVKKAQTKLSKMREKQILGPYEPPPPLVTSVLMRLSNQLKSILFFLIFLPQNVISVIWKQVSVKRNFKNASYNS